MHHWTNIPALPEHAEGQVARISALWGSSMWKLVSVGVPQSSILEPFFPKYTNEKVKVKV
jgi:hypothetical protein